MQLAIGWDVGRPENRSGGNLERLKAPVEGEPYETARMWLLERLQIGPVSTFELRCPPWRASQNPAQRVLELRNRQFDIRTVKSGGRSWYWLWEKGLPVGEIPGGYVSS